MSVRPISGAGGAQPPTGTPPPASPSPAGAPTAGTPPPPAGATLAAAPPTGTHTGTAAHPGAPAPGNAPSPASAGIGVAPPSNAASNLAARAFASLRKELAANPRLRAGAWAIAGILILQGLLMQGDRVEAAYAAYAASASQLARAEGLTQDADWPGLLAAERARAAALAERAWQAESPGLAQARLQAAVTEITEGLEFRNPIVQAGISRPVPEVDGLWQAQAQFSGIASPGAELEVIRAIAKWPRKLVIDRLHVRRRDSRLTVLLSAYFDGVQAPPEEGVAGG